MLAVQFKQRLPLLAHNRNYRWLWASTIFTASEEVLHFTALPLYVLNLTGSGAALAGLWAVQTLAALLAGPLAGVVADRFNRRRVWLALGALIAATFALYPFAQTLEQLFALIAVYAAANTFARNVYLAMLPDLIAERELVDANALISMNFNVVLTVAPLVAGGLLAVSGARIVFTMLMAARLCAVICISRITYAQAVTTDGRPRTHTATFALPLRMFLGDMSAGLRYARDHATVRALLVTSIGMNIGLGGLIVMEALLIKQVLGAGDFGFGLMLSVAGLGAIGGSLLIKPTTNRWPLTRVFAVAVLLTGLSFFPYANILWFPATLVIACAQTLTFVMAQVLTDTIIQRNVPAALRGRVFGLMLIVRSSMTLLAVSVFGPLVDSLGVVLLLTVSGVCYTLAGLYAVATLRHDAALASAALVAEAAGD